MLGAKMNPKIKDQWVKALRSGKYTQGRNRLKENIGGQTRYCCLGVLCEIMDADWSRNQYGEYVLVEDGGQNYPAPSIVNAADLPTRNPEVRYGGGYRALANLNDDGYSFPEIANWIEESL